MTCQKCKTYPPKIAKPFYLQKIKNKERLEKLGWRPAHIVHHTSNLFFLKKDWLCELISVSGKLKFRRVRQIYPRIDQ